MRRIAALPGVLLLFQAAALAEEPPPSDPVIEKARAAATSFLNHLPNYLCREVMARHTAPSRDSKWRRRDVVTADLVYEGGNEDYRNIALNGKAVLLSEVAANWSRGEFATEMAMLFSPVSDTEFRPRGEEQLAGRDVYVYDYQVRRARSLWSIAGPSGRVLPAYGGSIWIDRQTWRLLRIERRTEVLPPDFPWHTVEGTTEFGIVRLGDEEALLPVRSEMVSCQRNALHCIRNAIEFRDYRKFGGESTIKFTQ